MDKPTPEEQAVAEEEAKTIIYLAEFFYQALVVDTAREAYKQATREINTHISSMLHNVPDIMRTEIDDAYKGNKEYLVKERAKAILKAMAEESIVLPERV